MLIVKNKWSVIIKTEDMGCHDVDTKNKDEGNSLRAAFLCVALLSEVT